MQWSTPPGRTITFGLVHHISCPYHLRMQDARETPRPDAPDPEVVQAAFELLLAVEIADRRAGTASSARWLQSTSTPAGNLQAFFMHALVRELEQAATDESAKPELVDIPRVITQKQRVFDTKRQPKLRFLAEAQRSALAWVNNYVLNTSDDILAIRARQLLSLGEHRIHPPVDSVAGRHGAIARYLLIKAWDVALTNKLARGPVPHPSLDGWIQKIQTPSSSRPSRMAIAGERAAKQDRADLELTRRRFIEGISALAATTGAEVLARNAPPLLIAPSLLAFPQRASRSANDRTLPASGPHARLSRGKAWATLPSVESVSSGSTETSVSVAQSTFVSVELRPPDKSRDAVATEAWTMRVLAMIAPGTDSVSLRPSAFGTNPGGALQQITDNLIPQGPLIERAGDSGWMKVSSTDVRLEPGQIHYVSARMQFADGTMIVATGAKIDLSSPGRATVTSFDAAGQKETVAFSIEQALALTD